ncbi:MAG TPA: ABC transporter ATP-binding protein [Thermodesulfobacteriota bacterium]|nr:ABC transporter ATP-binding protein [Thermodesulfobacteriota bacterium]
MSESILNITNLVKDYKTGFTGKKTRVLRDVSFDVRKGEVFGFVGPNGAGKTTTFKLILGFVSPTEGKIELLGEEHSNSGAKSRIGYLPENPYFYDYLTGEELLRYMGELHGLGRKVLNERTDELLRKVSMEHAKKLQMRKYSKGMLQRIGVAQALVNDPEFLILDEPMSGLDPIGRREIKDLILEEKRKGKTILLSSHMLSDVEALCDRVGIIMGGTVIKIGNIGDLLKEIHTDYEMHIEGSGEDVRQCVKDLRVEMDQRAGYIVLKFDEDMKRKVLEAVTRTPAEIVSIHPLRKSLEGLFVEEARKGNTRNEE